MGAAIFLGLAAFGFIVLDVGLGERMSLECVVTGKYYVPPATHVTRDHDGDVSISTDPEEFHVTVRENTDAAHDVSTNRRTFARLTNGESVRVGAKLGKWTHIVWLGGIEP